MKGKILTFKADKGFGFILGEDNQKYFFHISAVSNPMDIEEGYSVDFKIREGKKGLNAVNITVQTPLSGGRNKDKILKIKDLRIRASDIKEYTIIKEMKNGCYSDENNETNNCSDSYVDEDGDYYESSSSERFCYTLLITTYTSGERYIYFISHNEDTNKEEGYKWLNYIDEELEELL